MYANVTDDNAGVLAYPLFLLVTVPLLWRSVAPVQATGAALGGLVVHDVLFGTDVVRCGVVLPTTFFGAGDSSLVDTVEERVDIDDYLDSVRALALFIAEHSGVEQVPAADGPRQRHLGPELAGAG